ncbi:mycothiol conjugate amidase Mca [Rathayibacter rathayi]|uniref:mycothiol conjugate amidase Mca n=1 Tax=Rathayibacter rathayi TaxID=33887 RepID=UPI000CE74E3F|nr:mycothiol conjugate amidase Mca [Rathayibacter rathayi]PPF52009.1 mycothiol conjugate amidase Mca [Rathayibacter rathayi]PPF83616.1 mycothiol conjugate amidase Mca [Rathayibacter rathayi]PPG72070.1 mycothiol conjugate amidase Mca [Rathayibacter rathayi]PPG78868.1 mycothiol conjugate amidase Mca [Rathayibacter rathayi]PPI76782.1 mycothiol conjugate amidase Mca [Rathayibacter rathayi]
MSQADEVSVDSEAQDTPRLLAVHAHPDDESSKGAATLAAYAERGAEVMVVSCTGGEAGSVLNEGLEARAHAERDIGGLRRHEMAAARDALGVQHTWLGFVDSGMPEDGKVDGASFAGRPLATAAAPLVRLVRRFRPHVIISYDENGGYPHPDHIRAHQVAVEAYRAAGLAEQYRGTGAPWSVLKLYYDRVFSGQKLRAIAEHLRSIDPEDPRLSVLDEMKRWNEDTPYLATTRVVISGFHDRRDAALLAHASQVAPDNVFFFLPHEAIDAAWPTDDFQLVDSRVDAPTPETDLFAGLGLAELAPGPTAVVPPIAPDSEVSHDAPVTPEPDGSGIAVVNEVCA